MGQNPRIYLKAETKDELKDFKKSLELELKKDWTYDQFIFAILKYQAQIHELIVSGEKALSIDSTENTTEVPASGVCAVGGGRTAGGCSGPGVHTKAARRGLWEA